MFIASSTTKRTIQKYCEDFGTYYYECHKGQPFVQFGLNTNKYLKYKRFTYR